MAAMKSLFPYLPSSVDALQSSASFFLVFFRLGHLTDKKKVSLKTHKEKVQTKLEKYTINMNPIEKKSSSKRSKVMG